MSSLPIIFRLMAVAIKEQEKREEKDARSRHMPESRMFVARAGNMTLVQNLKHKIELSFRSTKAGRAMYGACSKSATSIQMRALNASMKKPLEDVCEAKFTM